MEMQLEKENGNRLVLTCAGQIGWDDRESLVQRVQDAAGTASPAHVLMDLEAVDYINSAGLGALFQLTELLGQNGGKLVLANVPPTLQKLFKTVALNRLVHCADTLEDARAFVQENA